MITLPGVAQPNDANNEVVLSVKDVSKSFRLPTEQATGLKQAFINWTKGIKGYREQEVLKDISFNVHKGDFFGIVGRNGSGKSTLLKVISQIYKPEYGSVTVHGKLVPFIELGVGFNPELTGRENVFLNGALLGFTHDEIAAMYDDIVSFAELEEFMDQKLKNYSSGMQVRLAFSVAIKAQGDILVLDEVLAVGDEAFQRKCDAFFKQVQEDPNKTVILVTHDMGAVKKYCNKAVLIRDGHIIVDGDKEEAANQYTIENLKALHKTSSSQNASETPAGSFPPGLNVIIPELKVTPTAPLTRHSDDEFSFDVTFKVTQDAPMYPVVSLLDVGRGGVIADTGDTTYKIQGVGKHTMHFSLPLSMFNNGQYRIYAHIRTQNEAGEAQLVAFTNEDNDCIFSVENAGEQHTFGLLNEQSFQIQNLGIEYES